MASAIAICSAKSVRKIDQTQTGALRFLYKDFDSDYRTILDRSDKWTIKSKFFRTLGLEVFKALNDLNPVFMEQIFHRTKCVTHRPNNVKVNVHKTAKYVDKSLRIIGPHIWIHSQSI